MSAGFGRRFAALIYDALLCAALLMVYTGVALLFTHGRAVIFSNVGAWMYVYRAGLIVVISAYFSITCAHTGHTLGMRAWRLKMVTYKGTHLGYGRVLWRFTLAIPAWSLCALGILWLYADPQRLALQDRFSGTRIIVL